MKANGYTTARFGKNDYGLGFHDHEAHEYPLNHGYDEFLGFSAHGHDYFLLTRYIEDRTPDPKGHSAVVGPLRRAMWRNEFLDARDLKSLFSVWEELEQSQRLCGARWNWA